MSDTLSLDLLGGLIRSVQADQRTIRTELEATRHELRSRLDTMERALGDRSAIIEARIETRFDQMQSEMVRALDEVVKALRGSNAALSDQSSRPKTTKWLGSTAATGAAPIRGGEQP